MIAIVQPSRGLIFTEAVNALDRNFEKYKHKFYRSYDMVIPDCFNFLTEQALKDGAEYVFYSEEDTVMPDGGFERLLAAQSDIAAIDYAVAGWSCITRDKTTNEILWTGLGCTLVKREVFDKLEKPYFRSDKALLLNTWPNVTWIDAGQQAYGGQDIYFCMMAREKGFNIEQVDGECRHLRLKELGRPEINKGLHIIEQKETISRHQTL